MHEYSVVQSLLEQCENITQINKATKVIKVVVKIGVMSGIEAHLLEIAFNTFKEKTVCHDAKFIMNIQPIVIKCNICNTKSELNDIQYSCPRCQSIDLDVIDGEDMFLMQLELE